jgi:lipoprotein-releasing system ATP-binding protein
MINEKTNKDDNQAVLICKGITKSFKDNKDLLEVLTDVNLTVKSGDRIAITGTSGSGKTTLLQIMGGLDEPTSGVILINGQLLNKTSEKQKSFIRNQYLGFVYQFHHLLAEFSAEENVAMPLLIRGTKKEQAMDEARLLLKRVGLEKRLNHRPSELSGGERQRAAVARALITRPKILLADEPTGNLDSGNGQHVMELMLELHKEFQTSLIVVTHDLHIAGKMSRTLQLSDGILVDKQEY